MGWDGLRSDRSLIFDFFLTFSGVVFCGSRGGKKGRS